MRLLLSISYCEAYLGNKEKAIHYLKQVKVDQDENYYLATDDIHDFQIFEVYYSTLFGLKMRMRNLINI